MIIEATKDAIEQAGLDLAQGRLVAFPTETVFGLGADARNAEAVAAIFALKRRPRFNPLIVHVSGVAMARACGRLSPIALRLIEAFWPGPLTIIVPRRDDGDIAELTTAGLETIALRAPSHPVAQALLRAARCPIAAPSANASGYVSPTRPEHVADDLAAGNGCDDRLAMILKGGPLPGGLESTVVDTTCDPPHLLRPGALTQDAIEAVLGQKLAAGGKGMSPSASPRPSSPGQLASHYAPKARLRLAARDVEPGEALLAFGARPLPGAELVINLSPAGNLEEAAAHLFEALRELDRRGIARAAVMPIPHEGLGVAINDRLKRAAAEDGARRTT